MKLLEAQKKITKLSSHIFIEFKGDTVIEDMEYSSNINRIEYFKIYDSYSKLDNIIRILDKNIKNKYDFVLSYLSKRFISFFVIPDIFKDLLSELDLLSGNLIILSIDKKHHSKISKMFEFHYLIKDIKYFNDYCFIFLNTTEEAKFNIEKIKEQEYDDETEDENILTRSASD